MEGNELDKATTFCGSNKGYGINNTNIVNFAVSFANVTDCDNCKALTNTAVLVAGGHIDAEQENKAQIQEQD